MRVLRVFVAGLMTAAMAVSVGAAEPIRTRTEKPARGKVPAGFVRLRDIAPDIERDMRYAGPANFTGRRVPGYFSNSCILASPVAWALRRVQTRLVAQGYRLKVYDCYRPARAVRSFVRWARQPDDGSTKHYFPRIRRDRIIPLGYVSRRSSHSLGTAIDLTIVRRDARASKPAAKRNTENYGSCIAGKRRRRPDNGVDMGTSWDCFDVRSHTFFAGIPKVAKANRLRLLTAMQAEGFRNYRREWWHFSMPLRRFRKARDFPVR